MAGAEGEDSAAIRSRVARTAQIQKRRFREENIRFNAEMKQEQIRQFCRLKQEDEQFLHRIAEMKRFSARACSKILKVARTIADMDGKEEIEREHLLEAAGYRGLIEKYWGGGHDEKR